MTPVDRDEDDQRGEPGTGADRLGVAPHGGESAAGEPDSRADAGAEQQVGERDVGLRQQPAGDHDDEAPQPREHDPRVLDPAGDPPGDPDPRRHGEGREDETGRRAVLDHPGHRQEGERGGPEAP